MTRERLPIDRILVEARLDAELSFARRHGTPLGLLLIHADAPVLENLWYRRAFVDRLRAIVRAEDELGCIDDSTFALVVRGIAPAALQVMAERLCRTLRVVSIGIGVADALRDGETTAALTLRARTALEDARAGGGGRVAAC